MKVSPKYSALALASLALLVNFWAWSLLSPLANHFLSLLRLSPFTLSVVLAMPVIIGAVGRIPVGLLTDTYGGRRLFTILCFSSIVPVVCIPLATSYISLLLVAIVLGIAGTSFAIGVPFINSWFTPKNRGLALGIYSMGNAGTAMAGLLTPRLLGWLGVVQTVWIVAITLAVLGLACWRWAQNAPGWSAQSSSLKKLPAIIKQGSTWDLAIIYIITFGAFVAFGMYLPVLLSEAYALDPVDAAARAAGFVLLATLSRPVGGWLSDRIGGTKIIRAALGLTILLALVIASQVSLTIVATVAFLTLAAVLGSGSGAVIAVASKVAAAESIGTTVGVVGAVGGLGGFLPPMVLGLSFQLFHSYTPALLLLAVASLVVLIYVSHRFREYPIAV